MAIDIQWVVDDATLIARCSEWRKLPFVALDTEFMRVDTFYPIAGLIQISDGQCAYLIDPLSISDWSAFAALLTDVQVVKVIHAGGEDLEVLRLLTGSLPVPLFDTQIAAGYLNIGFSMGYSRLVQAVLDVELPKGETRSDWLQRPLDANQVRYAADDVVHLAEVYQQLCQRLTAERMEWILQDGAEMVETAQQEKPLDEAYLEVKQAWKLDSRQLAVLRALCLWREEQARLRDQPRNRVLRERSLWPLARKQPRTLTDLAAIEDMHPKTVRQDGETILGLIADAAALPDAQCPPVLAEPLPLEANALIKKLRAIAHKEGERLEIVPELMLRKKIVEALLKSGYPDGPYRLPDSLRGWRRELLGQALLDCLAKNGQTVPQPE